MSAHLVKRPKYHKGHSPDRSIEIDSLCPNDESSDPATSPGAASAFQLNIDPANYYMQLNDLYQPQTADSLFAPPSFLTLDIDWPEDGQPPTASGPSLIAAVSPVHHNEPAAVPPESPSSFTNFVNPFQENANEWITRVGESPRFVVPGVNGYIKCGWPQWRRYKPQAISASSFRPAPVGKKRPLSLMSTSSTSLQATATSPHIPRSPPDIGYRPLDRPDRYLDNFYKVAWCAGRTILRSSNCWFHDIPAMASQNNGVFHAMLALASTYVYDYVPEEPVRVRSNRHYNKAVAHLTSGLREFQARPTQGDDETLVASIALLNMMDVISPERRRENGATPRWLEGAQVACQILRLTDSGYRYWDTRGPEPLKRRTASTIISSRVVIITLPMTSLGYISTDNECFQFLLAHPSEEATREIHGACGCSPRLLHRFAQITDLATLLCEHNDSPILPVAAERMFEELQKLRQLFRFENEAQRHLGYSDTGYTSTEALLVDCDRNIPDGHGCVQDVPGMTFLTAEAWRLAAIIYLQCRLLRLPRSNGEVVSNLSRLSECVRRMPTSGSLFTAQAPFFPVFLLGLLALDRPPEPKEAAMHWFKSVTSTSVRSSVPPAYRALDTIRPWMGANKIGLSEDTPPELKDRPCWWEDLVDHIAKENGILCLV